MLTKQILYGGLQVKEMLPLLTARMTHMCNATVYANTAGLERLDAMKFDLVLVDGLFFMKCLYLIPHRLGVPFITYTDEIEPLVARVPWLPSFVPFGALPFTDQVCKTLVL